MPLPLEAQMHPSNHIDNVYGDGLTSQLSAFLYIHATNPLYQNMPPPLLYAINTNNHFAVNPEALLHTPKSSFKTSYTLFSLRRNRIVSTNIVCSIAKMETTFSSH